MQMELGQGIQLMDEYLDFARRNREGPPSYLMDLMLLSDWSALNQVRRTAALREHVASLSTVFFHSFRSHALIAVENAKQEIATLKGNEDKAWGGYLADRMAYLMARIRTGQRDPKFLAELRDAEQTLDFLTWVLRQGDIEWHRSQR